MSEDTDKSNGDSPDDRQAESAGRRRFIAASSSAAMAGGLVTGYGVFAAYAGRFLYPSQGEPTAWQYLVSVKELKPGDSLSYTAPSGATVVVARQTPGDTADDFIALSSVCPHLGCQVHWEPLNERFFCPCHNGAFDAQGQATAGPPEAEGQQLKRYPLKVESGLLFILVPLESISMKGRAGESH